MFFQLLAIENVYGNVANVDKQKTFCHITPVLIQLHWLPVLSRMNFKISLLTFKVSFVLYK